MALTGQQEQIVDLLIERGPMAAREIAARMGTKQIELAAAIAGLSRRRLIGLDYGVGEVRWCITERGRVEAIRKNPAVWLNVPWQEEKHAQ